METTQIIGFVFLFLVAVVPILGFTAHLVLKPLVDAIIRLRHEFADRTIGTIPEHRLVSMENDIRLLRQELGQLADVREFYRALNPGDELKDEMERKNAG